MTGAASWRNVWAPVRRRGKNSSAQIGVTAREAINEHENCGSIYFSISHAFAIPVPVRAPEIDATSAASSLMLLSGAIAVMRGRKVHV